MPRGHKLRPLVLCAVAITTGQRSCHVSLKWFLHLASPQIMHSVSGLKQWRARHCWEKEKTKEQDLIQWEGSRGQAWPCKKKNPIMSSLIVPFLTISLGAGPSAVWRRVFSPWKRKAGPSPAFFICHRKSTRSLCSLVDVSWSSASRWETVTLTQNQGLSCDAWLSLCHLCFMWKHNLSIPLSHMPPRCLSVFLFSAF